MKLPVWEQSSGITLATMFAKPQEYTEADLYTIECASGPVLRYTTSDRDVAYAGAPGVVWSAKEVRVDDKITKAVGHWTVGLNVNTFQVPMYPRVADPFTGAITYPDKIGSIPFIAACNGGFLDNAKVTVDRAIFTGWSDTPVQTETPVGVYRMFVGDVAEVDFADVGIILNINSLIARLGVDMPNRLFQAPCIHTLFDVGCTLVKASFAVAGTVATVGGGLLSNQFTSAIGAPPGSGDYTLGRVFMTSGLNAGFGRLVRAWAATVFTLSAPFPFTLAPGNTFTAFPGCNKTFAACTLFANAANYGGERNIPAPELAI